MGRFHIYQSTRGNFPHPPGITNPENTIYLPDAGLMLGQRRKQWTSIKPASDRSIVFTGNTLGQWGLGRFYGHYKTP